MDAFRLHLSRTTAAVTAPAHRQLCVELESALETLSSSKGRSRTTFMELSNLRLLLSSLLESILPAFPDCVLPLLAAAVTHATAELSHIWTSSVAGSRFVEGGEEMGAAWESVVEGILIGLKCFLRDTEPRLATQSSAQNYKDLTGVHCLLPLAKVLRASEASCVLQRRVLDVFEYATRRCPANKERLLQVAVLGPHILARLISAASDFGVEERAVELAFCIGHAIGTPGSGNSLAVKSRWESLLFPKKLYGSETSTFLAKFRSLSVDSYADDSPALLQMLSARDPLSFKTVFGLSLHANGLVLENEDGDVKPGTTFGAQVAFNAATLTAVTTRALDAAGDDIVELLLEVDYRTFDSVNIVTKGAVSYVHIVLTATPTLDSVPLQLQLGTTPSIRIEIRSSDRKTVEAVLLSRGINQRASSPVVGSLPTPKFTPASRSSAPIVAPTTSSPPPNKIKATKRSSEATADPVTIEAPKRRAPDLPTPSSKHTTRTPRGTDDDRKVTKTVAFADDSGFSSSSEIIEPRAVHDGLSDSSSIVDEEIEDEGASGVRRALNRKLSGMSTEAVQALFQASGEQVKEVGRLAAEVVASEQEDVTVVDRPLVRISPYRKGSLALPAPAIVRSKSFKRDDPLAPRRDDHRPRSIPSKALRRSNTSDERQVSAVLQELSSVLLQQYVDRKGQTSQSFDASMYVLDSAVAELGDDFNRETESITYAITQSMVYFEAAQKDAEAAVKRFVSQTKLGLRGIKG